jgi:hypothetical protein
MGYHCYNVWLSFVIRYSLFRVGYSVHNFSFSRFSNHFILINPWLKPWAKGQFCSWIFYLKTPSFIIEDSLFRVGYSAFNLSIYTFKFSLHRYALWFTALQKIAGILRRVITFFEGNSPIKNQIIWHNF